MLRIPSYVVVLPFLICLEFSLFYQSAAASLQLRGNALQTPPSALAALCGKVLPCKRMTLRGGGMVVPGISWSQREETLLLKIEIPSGASADGLTVNEKSVEWKEGDVNLDLELFAAVEPASATKKSDGGRVCTLELKKADGDWWPKLSSGKTPKNVKVDWATWKDEDEAETEKYSPRSAGMESMGEMGGGGGGMGGGGDFNFDDMDKDDGPWVDDKDEDKADKDAKEGDEGEGMKDEDGGEDEPKIEEVGEDATMPDA